MLIGLGGYAEAGKDAVADFLTDEGWFKTYMSHPLERALLALNPWVRITAKERRVVLGNGPETEGFAWLLYAMLHREVGYEKSKKVENVRVLLQRLGTEVGRNMLGEDIWVDKAFEEVRTGLAAELSVTITGIRYENELRALRQLGGVAVWVARPSYGPVNAHSSDNTLGRQDFDVILDNNGSLEDLRTVTLNRFVVVA